MELESDLFSKKSSVADSKFEINDISKDENGTLLLALTPGKILLSNPNRIFPQKRQDGATCVYGALHYVRARYKGLSEEMEERKIEKVFSQHRKAIGSISKQESFEMQAAETFSITVSNLAITHEIAKHIKENRLEPAKKLHGDNAENLKKVNNLIDMVDDFLASSDDDLKKHLEKKFGVEIIKVCKRTLSKLGVDHKTIVEEQFKKFHADTQIIPAITDEVLDHPDHYIAAVDFEMYKGYKLTFSDWKKTDQIEYLIEQLKTYGPHVAGGYFSIKDNIKKALEAIEKENCSWDVYDVTDELYAKDSDEHAIVILGVEIEEGENYILYIDPTDELSINSRKLYSVPFDIFKSRLRNIYGAQKEGPFLIHGDYEKLQKLIDNYKEKKPLTVPKEETHKEEAQLVEQFISQLDLDDETSKGLQP